MDTFEKIKEIINLENIDVIIKLDSIIQNDLNLDSLDVVEKLLLIEKFFEIEISDNDLVKIETIRDIVSIVDKLK